ncbi:MAG: Heavy metal transport/detoxification protein, partial [bacterium]
VSAGNVQKVILGMKNYNYNPNTITVKAGQPVSITLDSSVQGCLRSFAIKDLGVSKYAKTPSETIDFTPTKKGTFTFACSMGMGYGTLVVE